VSLFCEVNHDLPIAQVAVASPTGASADPPGMDGLADLSAELLLRGAAGRSRAVLDEAIDGLGGSLHVQTETDYVRMVGQVLRRNLEPFLDVVADVLLRADLPEAELGKLKIERHGDLDEMLDDDRSLCSRFHARAVYAGTPYERPEDGTHESVERISRGDCEEALRARFKGQPLLYGLAGDLTPDDARAGLLKRFGQAVEGPLPKPESFQGATPSPPAPGRHLHFVDKPERTQVQILIGHGALPVWHPDALALQVALTAFGGLFSSPLMQEVRVKRGWSYGAHAWMESRRAPGSIVFHLFPANEQAPDALRLVLDLVEELAAKGPDPAMIDRAREYLENSLAMDMDTPEKRLARHMALPIFGMPADYLETYKARVQALTHETIVGAVRRYLHPGALHVTVLGTASASLDPMAKVGAFTHVERLDYDSF
jgi:zinc protease